MVSSGMLRRVVFTRATRRNIPEDTILHGPVFVIRCECEMYLFGITEEGYIFSPAIELLL
jgi:hypothetical protein